MPDTSLPEASSTTRSKDRATANDSSARIGSGEASRKAHFVLQGKGGVGKTFVASLLGQYYQERGLPFACLDADPVNASLSELKALNARHVPLLNGDKLDVDQLDALIEQVLTEDRNFIIDAGAASFVPLSRYLLENSIANLIVENGKTMTVHTIVTGGPALIDTLKAVAAVIEQFPPSVELVTWLNEYFGRIADRTGKSFEDTPLYQQHRSRLTSLVRLPPLNPDTFGADLSRMLSKQMTFAEADASSEFRIVAKQRLRQIKRPIFEQLALLA